MKQFFGPSALMIVVSLISLVEPACSRNQLPKDVQEFYEDSNYVSLMTSDNERVALAKLQAFDDEGKNTPSLPARFKGISKRIYHLQTSVLNFDTEMNVAKEVSSAPRKTGIELGNVIEIVSMRLSGSDLYIKLISRSIDPKIQSVMLANYDDSKEMKKQGLTINEYRNRSAFGLPQTEMHRWKRVGQSWKKVEGETILLQDDIQSY
jgi:hypothetical protein